MRKRYFPLLVSLIGIPVVLAAQPTPDIDLDPAIECWYHSDFPMLSAAVDPTEEIVSSRLYFRCSSYPDYYFVDLETEGGKFTGVAPQAEESCPSVHYYVEAVTRDYTSARTEERIAEVSSHTECRRRGPAGLLFPGEDPRIVLGSTVAGPEMAPGFKSLGITSFLTAGGATVAATGGGGSSTALILGAVAAGAGAAAAAVLSGDSSSPTPPPAPVATPPSPPVGGVPGVPGPPQDVKACVRFEPIDAIVLANQPLKIDARCSEGGANLEYIFDLGDGRIKRGQPFVTAVWPSPGTYTLVLTVRRAGTSVGSGARLLDEDVLTRRVRVESPFEAPVADFVVRAFGTAQICGADFDGSPSTGDISAYLWQIDVNNDLGEGVVSETGQIVQHTWMFQNCLNNSGMLDVELTVLGQDGTQSVAAKPVMLFGNYEESRRTNAEQRSFVSELRAPAGTQGQVLVPGRAAQPVAAGARVRHQLPAAEGRHVIEALIAEPLAQPGLWRFDFKDVARLAPGSLRVLSGREVSRGPRSIVLLVTGAPGERLRIGYELSR